MQRLSRCLWISRVPAFRYVRCYVTPVTDSSQDLRVELSSKIKKALKTKDVLVATTLRSILAEVQAADKVHKEGRIAESAIRSFIAKAIVRRQEAATQYEKAKRPQLAAKERQEAEILEKLLPPAMSELRIDEILKEIMDSDKPLPLGQVFKSFYGQVDKSLVRPDVLKQRAQALLLKNEPSSPPTSSKP